MITDTEDTIAAIATPLGRAALGTIRISGFHCSEIVHKIFQPRKGSFESFRPVLGTIVLNQGTSIDEAILIYYEAPHSYTKENVAEITCHGNPFILDQLMKKILETGARLARPGEFTFRAFLNGRLDLVQAEAVNDLISADSLYQAEVALQQLDGRLSHELQELRSGMLELVSLLEGNIDFSEEQHYHFIDLSEAFAKTKVLIEKVEWLLGTFERGHLIREGLHVALVGRPNVGKSSIFNSLLGKNRAIVTPVPGTTRDFLQERVVLGKVLIQLLDTAGIRDTGEVVEKEGVKRSRQVIENADLILFVLDGTQSPGDEDVRLWNEISGKDCLVILNKKDLADFKNLNWFGFKNLEVSAVTGEGLPELLEKIRSDLENRIKFQGNDSLVSSLRHRDLLRSALEALRRAATGLERKESEEFTVLELHLAMKHLGEITGEVTIEDIYSEIFTKFCIGK